MKIIRIVIIVFFFSLKMTYGQSVYNIKDVDVDSMSDKKIKHFITEVRSKGMTIDQAGDYLRSKGVAQEEVDKLIIRAHMVELNGSSEVKNKKNTELDEESHIQFNKSKDTVFSLQKKVKDSLYGSDFFSNSNISFSPNINKIVPEKYQLGVGDVLKIDVWGASEASYKKQIDKQGNIYIEGVGRLVLAGLEFKEAKSKIQTFLSRIYAGIKYPSSSYNKIYVGVSLAEVKTIQVNMIGEINTPGTYSIMGMSSVLNALYLAGGPTNKGNYRKISVIRNDKKIAVFDFYNYLKKGNTKGNIQLRDQDIVLVDNYESLVTVKGEVRRPGKFQIKHGETLKDLLKYTGGLSSSAYNKSVIIERVNGVEKKIIELDLSKSSEVFLGDGDIVFVKKISGRYQNIVHIDGAVKVSGKFEFVKGMTVKDLIVKASGLTKEAFTQRGLITRFDSDVDKKIISFSLNNLGEDIKLAPSDKVHIYSEDELRVKRTIRVVGAVNKPDTYEYVQGMQIEDIIAMSGGLSIGADPNNIEVSRRNDKGGFEKLGKVFKLKISDTYNTFNSNFYLKPFDIVSVRYISGYSEQKTVAISGEVKHPGKYVITSKNERISDLIQRAGGLSPFSYIGGATLLRKRKGKIAKKQLEFLKELKEKDSVLGSANLQKKEFRIGINLDRILKNKGGVEDLILEENDELIVPTIKQTVEVRGEVYSPSMVQYSKGKSLKYYVNSAGGFTNDARRSGAYVIYSNGSSAATSNYFLFKDFPEVKPGSIVLIPKREEKRKMSAQEVISITTGLATLAMLVDRFMARNSD